MAPYLERSSDLQLQSQLSKVYKEVDGLYQSWLHGHDVESVGPPIEEDWDEDAEVRLCAEGKLVAYILTQSRVPKKDTIAMVPSRLKILDHTTRVQNNTVTTEAR